MENVTIYKTPKSPFWQLAYFDAKQNKRVWKSSRIRIDDPMGRRNVLQMARDLSAEAKGAKPVLQASAWEHWADQYLRDRYPEGLTRVRAFNGWKVLQVWLHESGLSVPAAIRYEHAQKWVDWRTSQKRHRGTFVSRNTALTDLRFLTILLREAHRRGYCDGVAIDRPGLGRAPVAEKPEILPGELAKIRLELQTRPQWMADCFEVGIHQGCRLTEVQVPMERIDEARGTITFRGKGNKVFATALHPGLGPLIARARAEGRKWLVTLPPLPSKAWHSFFREIELPHLCFHCTRVTVVTALARAGVPIQHAMRFVGHSSEIVHKIYQRLAAPDLSLATSALSSLSSSVTTGSPDAKVSKPRRVRRS
jgi:integrase